MAKRRRKPKERRPYQPAKLDSRKWDDVCTHAIAHEDKAAKDFDRFLKQYRYGKYNDSRGASANNTFGYINMLLSLMLNTSPSQEVDARENATAGDEYFQVLVQLGLVKSTFEAKELFAQTAEDTLSYTYEESDMQIHNQAALFEAAVRGMGITKESWDSERNIDRIDCVPRGNFYVDPFARYQLKQAYHVTHTFTLPIEAARSFFDRRGVNPANIHPNFSGADDKNRKNNDDETEKDLFKCHEIWCKSGDQRKVIYRPFMANKDLTQTDWPFELDHDDYPFSVLTFNRQYQKFNDAFPDLEVVYELQSLFEDIVLFYQKHTKRSIARKILIDKEMVDEDQQENLMNAKDMLPVWAKSTGGKSLAEAVKILDFSKSSQDVIELAQTAKALHDEAIGADELTRGGETDKNMTAREAQIRDINSKLRTSLKTRAFDRFLINQTRHRAQILRQLLDQQKVASICGLKNALVWSLHAGNAEDLVAEYSIGVSAGSTGERAKLDRIDRLRRSLGDCDALNQAYGAPIWNTVEMSTELMRLDGERNPEKWLNKEIWAQIQQQFTQPPMQPEMIDAQGQVLPPDPAMMMQGVPV